jgi:hypothetical protein
MKVMTTLPAFEVDVRGLARLLERRGKSFAVTELVQNAYDEDITEVRISLRPVPGRALAELVVEDDSPDGFLDLSHAWKLWADSKKKARPDQRGRFNQGEKTVIALCDTAEIHSTTGLVKFNPAVNQREVFPRRKRERGSKFTGLLRITRDELSEVEAVVRTLIPPEGVRTFYNDDLLPQRTPVLEFEAQLPTEIADSEGYLRPTQRKTVVRLHETLADETAHLYEMGIPVVELGDRFHVEIMQKVPLNTDRDNVTPSYLRKLRALVLDNAHRLLEGDQETASSKWVAEALESDTVSDEAVATVLEARFGSKRVVYDPSDPEANKLAVAKGYTVISPGSFNRAQWDTIRRTAAAKPAGQVTPSPKPYSDDPNAPVRKELDPSKFTDPMRRIITVTESLGLALLGVPVRVIMINDFSVHARATFGSVGGRSAVFEYNVSKLGYKWFEREPCDPEVLDLMIHEFGHFYSSDHLSSEYHDALTKVGGQMTALALSNPEMFQA